MASVLFSQIISNVPTTVLHAPFTAYPFVLLKGVNVGGLGILVASLANVISYKLYVMLIQINGRIT